ncbi:minor capsid protein [Apilactobacillus xinyiensis]|uniref:minor capsid protein n=1 Tax=Apilactobacillus xinyiensis TaxID=2841032 RepID=UPI00200FBB44|nr:minor capsid protein [Apilactobacillus xinyiensis]MCL0330602.1 minor capsid protein [Apilactobacillus xinyiensis]
MNSRDYWLRRFIQEKALSIKSSQDYELALNKRLDQLLSIFDRDIKRWYKRFSVDLGIPMDKVVQMLNGIEYKDFNMTLEEFKEKAIKGGYEQQLNSEYFKSQIARLKQLESQFKSEAKDLYSIEQLKMQDELVNQYQHTYLHDIYNIQDYKGMFEANFTQYSPEQLRYVIAKPWNKDGKDFSKRIWGTYTEELPSQLTDSLLRSTLTGASYTKVQKDFRERFTGVRSNHVHRLVVSEMAHVQEEASAEAYKSQDVEKYKYLATLERNTCSLCGHLDGSIFKMSERITGKNYPIMHPYCRCTTVPYMEGLPATKKRWSEDGLVDNMSFDEWKHKVDMKPYTLEEQRAALDYKSSKAYIINDKLRNDYPLTSEDKTLIKNFDKLLDKLPAYKGKTLNRSLYFDDSKTATQFAYKYSEGKTLLENQYISSATDVYNPKENVRMIIKHNNLGKDFRLFNPKEKEIIFKRNTKFRVKKRYAVGNKLYLEVEAIE